MKKTVLSKLNLKFLTGSEFFLFLFFLLVSCCLWLMLTLNQDYEAEITVPVQIKQIPENAGFSSSGEETVCVRVRDRGTTLINYIFASFLPVTVDYSELHNNRGRLFLPVSSLKKRIEGQLLSSTDVQSLQPDTFYYYTRESALRVPIKLNGAFTVARQYTAGTPLLIPDSVWVYAPSSVADTLSFISTEQFEYKELRDSLFTDVALVIPEGIKCVPDRAALVVPVSPFAEKSFELPIMAVGFPENYRLRTFPSYAKVVVNISMAEYDKITEDDFEIGVNFSDVADSDEVRAKLHLLAFPSTVKGIRIVPSEVEYLIEQL